MRRSPAKRDPAQVSSAMRAVKSQNTAPERELRSMLKRSGYGFRCHDRNLPGCPDFVFNGQKLTVFVDGDYWHGRQWKLRKFSSLSAQFHGVNNRAYWIEKISRNMARDRKISRELRAAGWRVLRIWTSDLKANPQRCLRRIERALSPQHDKIGARQGPRKAPPFPRTGQTGRTANE